MVHSVYAILLYIMTRQGVPYTRRLLFYLE